MDRYIKESNWHWKSLADAIWSVISNLLQWRTLQSSGSNFERKLSCVVMRSGNPGKWLFEILDTHLPYPNGLSRAACADANDHVRNLLLQRHDWCMFLQLMTMWKPQATDHRSTSHDICSSKGRAEPVCRRQKQLIAAILTHQMPIYIINESAARLDLLAQTTEVQPQ